MIKVKALVLNTLITASAGLLIVGCSDFANGQSSGGPGPGAFEDDHLAGQFVNWDRRATPMLTLRVHGAGRLQTFADISVDGSFKVALPEVPVKGNYGTMYCGGNGKGNVVVVSDISLLTKLPGFSSPGRWDREHSVIGGAFYSDEYFSKNIGKEGGRRAQWLHSHVARTVDEGECNNVNAFQLKEGWNAFTVISGPSGGPHIYNAGLDSDLGWYWYGFPEDLSKVNESSETGDTKSEHSVESVAGTLIKSADWLYGEWSGVQSDVTMKMRLQPTGNVWLESIENGKKKTIEGQWSHDGGKFELEIPEGKLTFDIEQTSKSGFRLFGEMTGGIDIQFERKK